MSDGRAQNPDNNKRLKHEIELLIKSIEKDLEKDRTSMHLATSERIQLGRDISSLKGVLSGKKPTTMETRLWMKLERSLLDIYHQ